MAAESTVIIVDGDVTDAKGDVIAHGSNSGTATPFYDGVFLTAAHNFDRLINGNEFYYNMGASTTVGFDNAAISYIYIPDAYVPLENVNSNTPNYDKSIITAPEDGRNSFVFFSDNTSLYYFLKGKSISRVGAKTSDYGEKLTFNGAIGQFDTTGAAVEGDSGGPAYVTENGTDYVIGTLSAGGLNSLTYSYYNIGDYYSALNLASNPHDQPDVILRGFDPKESVNSKQGHASIIENGDDDSIAVGSGGGTVNVTAHPARWVAS